MIRTAINNLQLFQFGNLNRSEEIEHYITTRVGGVSQGFAGSMNLSYSVGDDPGNVQKNRELLAEALGIDSTHLVFPRQTHSTNWRIVTGDNFTETFDDTDALITATPGIGLCVMSADCVPVLLYDARRKVVAAVHSGWKGTVKGIVRSVVEAMADGFGSRVEDILAGIGPSICAANYEVGPEVISAIRERFHNCDRLLSRFHDDKACVDLWEANRTLLLEAGLHEEHIEVSGLCTFQHPDLFYSARYSKNYTGRFAAAILIK